jgi:Concanavalin A-like lectin/glucanases superfamily
MRSREIFPILLALVLPLTCLTEPARAATLTITIDPNSYSGSGNIVDTTAGISGTPTNVTYSSSTNCGVFTFSGNGKISFPTTNFGSQFSVSAWVKPTSASSIQTLIATAGSGLNTNGFKIGWNEWQTSNLKMLLENGNGTSGTATVSSNAAVVNSTWQHLVYTIDVSSRAIKFYKDGTLIANNGTLLSSNPTMNSSFYIGAMTDSSYYMNAQIGIMKIYSTVLTDAEVTSDYNSTSARYAATPTCPSVAAPSNSSAPTISGTAAYNSVLTAANGTWTGNPTGYTYQWQSATTVNGTYSNISGATLSTYTPTTSDIGNFIKVQVTATNTGGSTSALSSATSAISKATQATLSVSLSTTSKTLPYSQALTLTPSGGTGTGTVKSAIAAGGTASGCALSDSSTAPTISATSYGTCLVTISKDPDTNYLIATSASVTFTFNRATPGTLTITTTSGTFGQNISLVTSGGQSTASDTYSVTSGPCTVATSTLTPTGSGTCYVTAYRAADSNYLATSSASTAITIAKASATAAISFTTAPVYRTSTTISASTSVAGTLRFLANNKVIPGCQSKAATAGNSYIATCTWSPTFHGFIKVTATFTSGNSNYNSGKIDGVTIFVPLRTTKR